MNQVKALMAGIYKYGFWLSCGLIAIASVAIGVMATMQVQENATKQVSRIKTAISSITPVSGIKDHPNAKTTEAWDQVNLDLERRVFQLWQQNFVKQRAILTWPEEAGSQFFKEIQDDRYLQPELITFPEPTSGLLSRQAADQYRNYIIEELPKLAPIIKAKWQIDLNASAGGLGGPGSPGGPGGMGPSGKGGGPGGLTGPTPGGIGGGPPGGIGGGPPGGVGGPGGAVGGMGSSQIYDPSEVVAWDSNSQALLASKVLRGMNRRDTPTTLDILYAQEDLWIVKALLNVIKKTNGDALERHRAPVKEIRTLATGQDAGTKVGGIVLLHAASSSTGTGSGPTAPGPTAPGPGAGGPGKPGGPAGFNPYGGGGAATAATAHPAELRYVDKKYVAKSWNEIKTAIESDAFADVELALAKRVPYRLTLVMDQRELNKFLINCGNNELMVEVSQVRYNPQAVSTGPMAGGGSPMGAPKGGVSGPPGVGGSASMGGGAAQGAGPGGEDGGAGSTGSSVAIAEPVGLSPYDILVDIYGYVQIYNQPATKKFKLLEAANSAAANGAANGAPAGANQSTPPTTAGQPTTTAPPTSDAPSQTPPAETPPAETPPAETPPAESTPPTTPPAETPPPESGNNSPPANGDGTTAPGDGAPPVTNGGATPNNGAPTSPP